MNDVGLPRQNVFGQDLLEVPRQESLAERVARSGRNHFWGASTRFEMLAEHVDCVVVSCEHGDRLANAGLCPGKTIDGMLDAVRSVQPERLISDMHDSEGHRTYGCTPTEATSPSTDLRTEFRLGSVAARTAVSRLATAQLASSSQRFNHCDRLPTQSSTTIATRVAAASDESRCARHAGPLDELWQGQEQEHQPVIEVVGRRERAQVDERTRVQSHEQAATCDRRLIAAERRRRWTRTRSRPR